MQVDPSLMPLSPNPDEGTGRMEMRPLSGLASGEPPSDVEQPPDMHEAMRQHNDKMAINRASMLSLDPNDPAYMQKLAAHQAKSDLLSNEHSHAMGKMGLPIYSGPGKAVPQGEEIPENQLPQDERKFKMQGLDEKISNAESDPTKWAEARAEKARFQKDNPLGSPGNHPGILGKIGHVAGTVGNVIGNAALGPGNMAFIPGSQANLNARIGAGAGAEKDETENAQREAMAGEAEARTGAEKATTEHTQQETQDLRNKPAVEPTLLQDYTTAVQDAIKHGQDPNKSPAVQQLSDAITGIQPQKPAADKTPPHITALGADGKSHIMERDPGTGQYSIDRGVAPPNYAQVLPQTLGTKTAEMLGPDNVQHRYQYNPETRKFDIDMGAAPTGTSAHQIFQGAAIEQLAPQIIADINANRAILGDLGSYYKQWLAGTPVSDPHAAQLMTELMSFAAMQPALHAFRSTSALEAFEKMVGSLAKNPDSTIATIQGLLKTPEAFTGLPKKGGGTTPAPSGRPSFAEWQASQPKTGVQ